MTGEKPKSKTMSDYFDTINHPFTEYETIEELLRVTKEATQAVGQEYPIETYDLGGCMKALPMIWKDPEKYSKEITLIGGFHLGMRFIGKLCAIKMKGSGYMEILMEAGLVTGGCMKNVENGTAYSKALFNLKASMEGFERMLIDQFAKEEDILISPQALLDLVTEVSRENLDKALSDESTRAVLDKYIEFQEKKVKTGHLGVTAQHWLSCIEKARELFMLLYSIKKNHVPLYHFLMGAMDELFFQTDGQNYARYLYI